MFWKERSRKDVWSSSTWRTVPELGKSITSYSTGAAAYDRMMQPWSQVYLPKLMGAVGNRCRGSEYSTLRPALAPRP